MTLTNKALCRQQKTYHLLPQYYLGSFYFGYKVVNEAQAPSNEILCMLCGDTPVWNENT